VVASVGFTAPPTTPAPNKQTPKERIGARFRLSLWHEIAADIRRRGTAAT
jgi:hypothetical protein